MVQVDRAKDPENAGAEVFEYPNKAMRNDYAAKGVMPYIVGFENDQKKGKGGEGFFNIILSNGARSE